MPRHATTTLVLLAATGIGAPRAAGAGTPARFFHMGTGVLKIRSTKNSHRFAGRYRGADGAYRTAALRKINRVFGADLDRDGGRVSLRLIELLSLLRDQLDGGWVVVSSGYRGPKYNLKIRKRGGTVALSSLHQYGMAADVRVTGVKSKKIWELVKQRELGGAGYYGSPWVHVDVGLPRTWTQSTANVRKGRSVNNKIIQIVPWFDIYRPGDPLRLRFVRMTAFPIGVRPTFVLERATGGETWKVQRRFKPSLGRPVKGRCPTFGSIGAMAGIRWELPRELPPGRYRVRARFCERKWEEMREETTSRPIRVVAGP